MAIRFTFISCLWFTGLTFCAVFFLNFVKWIKFNFSVLNLKMFYKCQNKQILKPVKYRTLQNNKTADDLFYLNTLDVAVKLKLH